MNKKLNRQQYLKLIGKKKVSESQYADFLKKIVVNPLGYYKRFLICDFKKGDRVLDFGCGFGGLLKLLKLRFNDLFLYGCDINKEIIKNNKQNPELSGISFSVVLDNLDTNFNDSFFDSIFLLDVLEHSAKPCLLLKELNRILKRKGKLVVNTPDKFSIVFDPAFYGSVFNFLPFNFKRLFGKTFLEYTHKQEYSYHEVASLLNQTGFKIIRANRNKIMSQIPWFYRGSIKLLAEKA
ncbi:class I SAM-dependent methyltransferase [Candidatus Microgenomates bacterium]|jgi:ubiquinone/menaquinone biosynthesis C-methylase UbiE|nr:MAG: class I SAM-dependent methyltransferase [Candidatus Microgenomates bacterium]